MLWGSLGPGCTMSVVEMLFSSAPFSGWFKSKAQLCELGINNCHTKAPGKHVRWEVIIRSQLDKLCRHVVIIAW